MCPTGTKRYKHLFYVKTIQSLPVEFVKDLFSFLMERKKWWLLPIILALVILGLLMVFAESSAVAPFVYPLF